MMLGTPLAKPRRRLKRPGRRGASGGPPTAGEIALKSLTPDVAKAEAYFERALAVARRQQAKSWELRAAMSMARLWRDQGSGMRPAISSLRSTAGSPKALTRSI